jgi:DNA-binding transcriptional LysR family regulator
LLASLKNPAFAENFGPARIARLRKEAPRRAPPLRAKADKDSTPLREGAIDLETGVVEPTTAPELRVQALFRDRLIGVARKNHPLSKARITAKRYAAAQHICVSRAGIESGPIDEALKLLGLTRSIVTIVGGFATAVALARATDLVAAVPERHTGDLRAGMFSFPLPVTTPDFTVSMLWPPLDADPAHRWLRQCVREARET